MYAEDEPAFDFVFSSLVTFEPFSVDNNSLLLPYSETINDPISATTKITNYLDFDLTEDQINDVHLKTHRLAIDRRNDQRRKSAKSSKDIKLSIKVFRLYTVSRLMLQILRIRGVTAR